jgi:plastocyanin
MRRTIARLLALAATPSLAILWLIAAPTASAGDPCYHGFDMPTTTTVEEANQIKLMPCAFGPTIAQVAVGSTVTFFNGPDFTHLVTGANQAWGSRDIEIQPGATVAYTFDTAGIYPYACALHRGMSGAIIVGDVLAANGGGSAGAGTTDAGSTTTGTAPANEATSATGPLDGPAMLALAVGAGLIVGAAIVVVVSRRRHNDKEPASPQAA